MYILCFVQALQLISTFERKSSQHAQQVCLHHNTHIHICHCSILYNLNVRIVLLYTYTIHVCIHVFNIIIVCYIIVVLIYRIHSHGIGRRLGMMRRSLLHPLTSETLIKLQLLYLHHKNCFESVNEVLCCIIFRESRSVSPQQEIHPVSLCQK